MSVEITKIKCPSCASIHIKKSGIRKNKLQTLQRYFCSNCQKTFTLQPDIKELKSRSYPQNLILKALTYYNLGYSQEQTSKLMRARHKVNIPQTTLSNWLKQFNAFLPYARLRKNLSDPESLIETHSFLHNNLPYKFQLHTQKLSTLFQDTKFNQNSRFLPLQSYLKKIPTQEFPHRIFTPNAEIQNQRASQSSLEALNIKSLKKHNLANKLAQLALSLTKNNKARHETIQNFMLANDSTTVAAEIPIYLTKDDLIYFLSRGFKIDPNNYITPVTGHIDVLQIRNNLIHILDYKPDAEKQKPIGQLTVYALALASRAKLPLTLFKCAWFDEKNYYEFFPLHIVYKLRAWKRLPNEQTRLNAKLSGNSEPLKN